MVTAVIAFVLDFATAAISAGASVKLRRGLFRH
jgi:hypothetical protein